MTVETIYFGLYNASRATSYIMYSPSSVYMCYNYMHKLKNCYTMHLFNKKVKYLSFMLMFYHNLTSDIEYTSQDYKICMIRFCIYVVESDIWRSY